MAPGLNLSQMVFYTFVCLTGYFGNDPIKETVVSLGVVAGLVYFIVLLLGFLFSNRRKTHYTSIPMMVVSLLPLVPFSILSVQVVSGSFLLYDPPDHLFSTWVKLAALIFLATHVVANTLYLANLNRK